MENILQNLNIETPDIYLFSVHNVLCRNLEKYHSTEIFNESNNSLLTEEVFVLTSKYSWLFTGILDIFITHASKYASLDVIKHSDIPIAFSIFSISLLYLHIPKD